MNVLAVVVSLKEITMPIKRCSSPSGTKGYKWGNSGKCYTGSNAKQKAGRQAKAAYANGYKGK
jgi:hypothetical protein